MHVSVGYSEHFESDIAGANAAVRALRDSGRASLCDMVLVFATAHHDMERLRQGIASVVGGDTPVIGGASVGAISNDRYGYSGEQVILAAIWLEGIGIELISKYGISGNEENAGRSIGRKMAEAGIAPDTACLLLYDAINRNGDDFRLNLATPLMKGIEDGLGFLPGTLIGAGLMGDYQSSATEQIVGNIIAGQHAMLLAFPGDMTVDTAIMHGCRPYGEMYTVTKAEGQTILEINGEPALPFLQSQMRPRLPAEDFPFFVILGVNKNPGAAYDEANYANRLCFAVDAERNGIVMFESDMVEGTDFQIMYRSLDLKYIPPKIESLFQNARERGRKPVLATYIDCAGRTNAYVEEEDAAVVQRAVAGRAPLLGIYSGVEIAPMMNKPRTLDWTGVFSLFTIPEKT